MAQQPLQSLYEVAIQRHQAGQLKEAEHLYRQILSQDPNHADALHMFGVLAYQAGQSGVALDLVARAIAINPLVASYHSNRGLILNGLGRFSLAANALSEALRLDPNLAAAYNNLGIALWKTGERDRAIQAWQDAIRLQPNMAEAHSGLGNAFQDSGQFEQAIQSFHTAIRFNPKLAEAHNNLGITLKRQGNPQEAIDPFKTAIQLQPNNGEYHDNLGTTHWSLGQIDLATQAFRNAIQLQPQRASFRIHLASALWAAGQLDQAIESINKAMTLDPNSAEACANFGNILKDIGNLEQAVVFYRRAVELATNDPAIHSSLIYLLHFLPPYRPEPIGEELKRWTNRHAQPLRREIQLHQNSNPDRQLRIGYISPDFREHAIGRFMLPILRQHDRNQYEIFCYGDVAAPDALTKQIETVSDHWRSVTGQPDSAVAQIIRQDQIDILIDLAAHTPANRLLVFARKPAPIQITYLSYPSTTGLEMMDYRITDPYLDPSGVTHGYYSERSLYLPETYWCYEAPPNSPEINPLPAMRAGYVTFGCLNAFRKVSVASLQTWGKLLQGVERSRLLLSLAEGSQRTNIKYFFQGLGIDPDRIEFVGQLPFDAYLRTYQRIDFGLDPFPYTGGTTTCDALWMGVPVVSLAGELAVHRGGVTILNNAGLSELVASDTEQYMDAAKRLANDLPRLADLRLRLRPQMENSPLMDIRRFVHNLEQAYRSVWRGHCQTAAP